MLRWKVVDRLSGRGPRWSRDRFVPPIADNDRVVLHSQRPSITWIGHATFVVRMGSVTIATDPVWSDRISRVVPRWAPPGVPLADVPKIDVVTISHNHHDHLDLMTLRRIGPDALYVTLVGNGALLKRRGFNNVVELDWWEHHDVGGVRITAVPARHWSMRTPFDRNETLWGGFVYSGAGRSVYHAGDTAMFDGFAEMRDRLGAIDYALLPIGAYEPRWFMKPQHMNPEDAADAYAALGARHLVAMHWGTFKLTDEAMDEPPRRMLECWRSRGHEPSRLWILDIGETRAIDSAGAIG